MLTRPLLPAELLIATRVFGVTLPYQKIFLTPLIGLEHRAFVTTVPPFTAAVIPICYLVNIGWSGFVRGMDSVAPNTLVHELTHVWQGAHSLIPSGFMWESIMHQGAAWVRGTSAYSYTPGAAWLTYNPEQQAKIVEDWFAAGESETDPLFPYIRDEIRSIV